MTDDNDSPPTTAPGVGPGPLMDTAPMGGRARRQGLTYWRLATIVAATDIAVVAGLKLGGVIGWAGFWFGLWVAMVVTVTIGGRLNSALLDDVDRYHDLVSSLTASMVAAVRCHECTMAAVLSRGGLPDVEDGHVVLPPGWGLTDQGRPLCPRCLARAN